MVFHIFKCFLNEWQWSVLWLYQIQNREGSCSICILDFPLCYRNSRVLVYWNENVSEVRLYWTNNDDMWLRLLYILRQWFCCLFVVDCCSWCGFCVFSMVCYALLCVFSRFALILMLASATSMCERRLDLKVYVFLLLLLWIFFVTYVSCLSCYLVVYLLQSCGHLLGKGWPLGSLVCGDLLCFITSRWGVLGQMWYLSASVADLCILSYFKEWK